MNSEYEIMMELFSKHEKYGIFETSSKEMNNKPRKFWMITGDGNSPKIRHYNLQDARTEVERLASANPGMEFYILQSVEMVQHTGITRHKF